MDSNMNRINTYIKSLTYMTKNNRSCWKVMCHDCPFIVGPAAAVASTCHKPSLKDIEVKLKDLIEVIMLEDIHPSDHLT